MPSTVLATDYHQWALDTAEAIRKRDFAAIDWEKVAEEIESLAGSEERALESHLAQLIYHLLKTEFQPERHGRSWDLSVAAHRGELYRLLRKQPSLKRYLRDPEVLSGAYTIALGESGRENLPEDVVVRFPETCPYSIESLLPEL
jgi:hypothetical protein